MMSRMCKDQTKVAVFGYETQNASHNEIHTDAEITVYQLHAFIQLVITSQGNCCWPQAFRALCMCVHASEQSKLPQLETGLAAVGTHWPAAEGSLISSRCGGAVLRQGVCLYPKLLCQGTWCVGAWGLLLHSSSRWLSAEVPNPAPDSQIKP